MARSLVYGSYVTMSLTQLLSITTQIATFSIRFQLFLIINAKHHALCETLSFTCAPCLGLPLSRADSRASNVRDKLLRHRT